MARSKHWIALLQRPVIQSGRATSCWPLHHLGRLRKEQRQLLLSERGGALSYDALQRDMPLLDATVRESTRLLPSAHTVFRRAQVSGPLTRADLTHSTNTGLGGVPTSHPSRIFICPHRLLIKSMLPLFCILLG